MTLVHLEDAAPVGMKVDLGEGDDQLGVVVLRGGDGCQLQVAQLLAGVGGKHERARNGQPISARRRSAAWLGAAANACSRSLRPTVSGAAPSSTWWMRTVPSP